MGVQMSETVNTAEIRITADSSGVEAGLRQATTAAERAERQIAGGSNNSARAQSNLIQAIQRTTAQMEAGSRTGSRYFEIMARQRGVDPAVLEPYLRQLRAIEEAQRNAANSAESAGDTIKKAIGSAVAGLSIAALGQQIISAQREFDKLNASLVTATGSTEKAAVAFAALQSFAATTPYGVAEATEAFIKMRNMGLDPSERALRSYGNTAAAMGKSLEQMVEAVADAATGEFERLKEFGIRASQNGEKVTLTFKGTSTTIKNEAEAIEKYLTKIGEVDFAGAMIQRAATLDGAISQLGDSWESTMRAISAGGIGQAAQDGVLGLSAALGDLETILNAISEAADKQGQKLSAATTIHKALTTVFEAVSVLGVNVAYVFRQVGNEIGGLAAQATAVATGNFTQARIIGEQMRADAERDRKEVDRQTAAILGAVETAKAAAAGAPKAGSTDVLAQFRIQREAERESDAAAKRRAEQIKRETAALAELAGLTSSFAEEWKMLSKLYGDGKINLGRLTRAQADLLAKQPAMKAAAEQEAKARKEADDFNKRYAESLDFLDGLLTDRIKSAKEEAEKNEEVARTYGMSAAAIAQEEVARLKNQLSRATEGGLMLSEIEHLEEMIKLRERSAAALASVEARDANAKAAEKAAQEWKRAAESIEQSLTDALLRGFESGKSFGQNLVDTLKNMFSTLVLRPVIQAAVQPMANQITGYMQGGSGSAAGASQMVGGLSSLFGGSGAGAGATSAGGASNMLGGAAGYAGWIAMGMAVADGLYKKGWDPNNGTIQKKDMLHPLVGESLLFNKIFRAIGISDRWASVLSGASLVTRLFGRKNPEIESQGIRGTFGGAGFDGLAYANILEKGGVFRSDKRYESTGAMSSEQDAAFDATFKGLMDAAKGFASTLGIEAGVIEGYNKQIKLELGKDEAKNQEAIANLFGEIGDELSVRLVPSLTEFKQAGETASATLQRLVAGYTTVDEVLRAIGITFGAVGVASLSARERLIEAAGGLEAFAQNTAGFQQNFLSEAERNAPVLKMVTEELAAMGLSAIDTREEFKRTVLGLDLTSEAGAKQYGALMKLQAAFAQVYPSTEAITAALAEQEEAARRAAEATQQAAEAARQAAIQATKDRASTLLSGVDSMFSALQSVVSREKSLLQDSANAHRALSQALRGTLDSMSVAGQGVEDRQSARAQIQAALAIAKAGGVLPDADSLKGALSVLSKDASSMFATQQDYLRDFYSTQNDIAALAGLTDDALSVEERSLKALDGILDSAQQQINALKGIDYSVLTLAQAISGFQGALGAAKADPVASAGGSIADLYRELLGRSADSAGLDYWQNAVAGGMTLEQVRKMIMEGAEYKGLRGFAVGTNYVPTNMPAMVHEGERIIPAADNRELMRRLSSPGEGNAALIAEIRALRTEVAGLKSAAGRTADATEKTAGSTGQLAEQFDNATDGGNAMRADVFNVVRTREVA